MSIKSEAISFLSSKKIADKEGFLKEFNNFCLQKKLGQDEVRTLLRQITSENGIARFVSSSAPAAPSRTTTSPSPRNIIENSNLDEYIRHFRALILAKINVDTLNNIEKSAIKDQIRSEINDYIRINKANINQKEQDYIVDFLFDDLFGLGPIEEFIKDDNVADILVNGPKHIYVERNGILELTNSKFLNDKHVANLAQRIASRIGRRVDESNPICDARLPDGSRVNIVYSPIAIDGCSISIRKFKKNKITLDRIEAIGSMSRYMKRLLQLAGRAHLNIIISGGTGSGKTTLLNAISESIDRRERIVTIEDAAELSLIQPHVVRLETRPPSIEGTGEITIRNLVKNALRMRPDRIILGEVRGEEAFDLLQAMNTGHSGSMGTLHANTPRDALSRLENMIMMGDNKLSDLAIKQQIASAIDLVVQASRLSDGTRKVVSITEILGIESETIITQELCHFRTDTEKSTSEKIIGGYVNSARPSFLSKINMNDQSDLVGSLVGAD